MFKSYFFPCYNTLFTKPMFSPVHRGLFSPKPAFKNYHFNQWFTPFPPPVSFGTTAHFSYIFINCLKDCITVRTTPASHPHLQLLPQRSTSHTAPSLHTGGCILQSTRFLRTAHHCKSAPHYSSVSAENAIDKRPSFLSLLILNPAVKRQHRAWGFKMVNE